MHCEQIRADHLDVNIDAVVTAMAMLLSGIIARTPRFRVRLCQLPHLAYPNRRSAQLSTVLPDCRQTGAATQRTWRCRIYRRACAWCWPFFWRSCAPGPAAAPGSCWCWAPPTWTSACAATSPSASSLVFSVKCALPAATECSPRFATVLQVRLLLGRPEPHRRHQQERPQALPGLGRASTWATASLTQGRRCAAHGRAGARAARAWTAQVMCCMHSF